MAGIYIHIPFCKRKCSYCDFYSQTNTAHIQQFVEALKIELKNKRNYLDKETIKTIYFGGGTPSLLKVNQVKSILETIAAHYTIATSPEITIEINPDDTSYEYFKQLLAININRVSIGLQSFNQNMLSMLGRRHTVDDAENAIYDAQKAGFKNISIDIIYGLPGMSHNLWIETLQKAVSKNIQHISAYHLTVESKTKLHVMLKLNKIKEIPANESYRQFLSLKKILKTNGYQQYEISNFALKGYMSEHNNNYWQQKKYLGTGPSAHSFNKESRQWNTGSITDYIKILKYGVASYSKEILTQQQCYNDYIITSLRTSKGIDIKLLKSTFDKTHYQNCINTIELYKKTKHIKINGNNIQLTKKGMFISDDITRKMISTSDDTEITLACFDYSDTAKFKHANYIRTQVFVYEQNVDEVLEFDKYESVSKHYLLYVNNKPVATARWRQTTEGIKLERFAVLKQFRQKGYAKLILQQILKDVLPLQKKITLNSQIQAEAFYRKQGFKPTGNKFIEAGIEHVKMEFQ